MTNAIPSVLGGSYDSPVDASHRIAFRRAVVLTLMTLVVPGSAQLAMGNKRLGRAGVRVWLSFLAVGLVLALTWFTSRQTVFSWGTDPRLLTLGRWILLAGAAFWVVLLVDALRLGRPLELRRKHGFVMAGINGLLCLVTAGSLIYGAHVAASSSSVIGTVFASDTVSSAEDGRYNILLLGGDSGPDRSGLRPDSLSVASIDKKTGKTVIIGLPRNLQNVPFTKGSVMGKEFPDGFTCDGCYLNAVNTWAHDHAAEFGDSEDPGLEATMDAAEAITGLKMNYYVLVNMHGLTKLVDAMGGLTVDVKERTAIGGIGSPIRGYIEKGERKLSGDQVLWYARSRVQNDDFSRMGRQKCVMNDMLQQLSPKKVLFNVGKIADSSKSVLTTNIPQQDLDVFMGLALKARGQKVATVSLVPPVVYTGNPDYPKIHTMIANAVAESAGTAPVADGFVNASLALPDLSDKKAADPKKSNQTKDLEATC